MTPIHISLRTQKQGNTAKRYAQHQLNKVTVVAFL